MTVAACGEPVGRLAQFARLGSNGHRRGSPTGTRRLLASTTTLPPDAVRSPLTRGSYTENNCRRVLPVGLAGKR